MPNWRHFAPTLFIILAGLIFGILASLLVPWGNPPNMGICVACFYRDVAGALGLHRAAPVQYLRPEIPGFLLGSFVAAYIFGEFRARGGSAPLVRFLLGALVMIGALVFLGCPIRATLRLAGGDLNGLTGLLGVACGAATGVVLLRRGFNLGRAVRMPTMVGWVMPLFALGLVALAWLVPPFLFASQKGPGSLHAPFLISLGAGLVVGFLAQRTRLCFVGGFRDLILVRDGHLFWGIAAFFVGALALNLVLGQFRLGFEGQPAAHADHLWNFMGMTIVGLGSTLVGGCPLRATILAGEGDTDAGVYVMGLLVGAATSHNFGLASSEAGPSPLGPAAVVVGLIILLVVGLFLREATSTLRRAPAGPAQ